MLPDYPEEKKKVWELLQEIAESIIKNEAPMLNEIQHVRFFEGDSWTLIRDDGSVDKKSKGRIEVSEKVSKVDLEAYGFDLTLQTIESMARQMAEKKMRMVFQHVEEVTHEVGNVVDGQGRPFDTEMIFEMYEKVFMDFNPDGTPVGKTLVMNPSMIPAAKEAFEKIENDPALKDRMEKILERKRKEWHDRQNLRKLVD